VKYLIQSIKKTKVNEQLALFDGNLEHFKRANSFSQQVKKLALKMGFRVTDETVASWEKHGTK
jgi:hypothetical protein